MTKKGFFSSAFLVTPVLLLVVILLGGCDTLDLPGLSQNEAAEVLETQTDAGDMYASLANQGDPDAAQATIAWLEVQPNVEDYGLSIDGTIWILYKCGIEGLLLAQREEIEIGVVSSSHSTGKVRGVATTGRSMFSPDSSSHTQRAVILLPFLYPVTQSGESYEIRVAEKVDERLRRAGLAEIDRYEKEDVTLDRMRTIGEYDVVFMITHGGLGIDQWIFTGERVTARKLWGWFTSLGNGIGYVDGKLFFMVNRRFISELRFSDSLVFMNACYSAKRDHLANAFLNGGAAVYFGWTERTYCREELFMGQVSRAIFDQLANPNVTVSQAYNAPVVEVHGDYCSVNDLYPATLYRDDDGDNKVNMCYATGTCIATPGEETEWFFSYELDFVYKGDGAFVLNDAGGNEERIAFVSSRDGNLEIYVMNADGTDQRRLTNNPAPDYHPEWSPDGKKLAFISDRDGNTGEIYVICVDGTNERRLTYNLDSEFYLQWSPDGQKIVFNRWNYDVPEAEADICVINADGTNERNLTNTPATEELYPKWHPDGGKILFSRYSAVNLDVYSDIYDMNPDGSDERNLSNNSSTGLHAAYSPNGTKIAYEGDYDTGGGIYVMNADGTHPRLLEGKGRLVSWVPNSTKIAYFSPRNDFADLYITDLDGSGNTLLRSYPNNHPAAGLVCWLEVGGCDVRTSWSSDGERVAFTWDDALTPGSDIALPWYGNFDIYVMNSDGTNQRRLTHSLGFDVDPVWSPTQR